MAPSGSLEVRQLNIFTKKGSYRRIPKWIIVVGIYQEYISIVY